MAKSKYAGKSDKEILQAELEKLNENSKYKATEKSPIFSTLQRRFSQARNMIEYRAKIKPSADFGYNYAEFYKDGKGAIQKLLAEASVAKEAGQDFSGQVAGAFEKQIDGKLSDIDLVWGNEKMGLRHIVEKHGDDFMDFDGDKQADKIANAISEIIQKGEVKATHNGYNIFYNDFKVGLNVGWNENGVKKGNNKWIVTAFDKSKSLSEKQGSNSVSFTKGETLPLNSNEEIIPKIAQKFDKDEVWAKNLFEWHKDSHELTKNADGTPKVFYHGSGAHFEKFERQSKGELGHFFTDIKSYANSYKDKNGKLYAVFLHIKNPLDLNDKKATQKYSKAIFGDDLPELERKLNSESKNLHELKGEWMRLRMDKYKKLDTNYIFAKKVQELGFDGIVDFNGALVVFDSNQIKAITNKGTFDSSNPNIYHANATLGGGVLGGSIAGVEYDENGNIKGFSPQNFALGFASGALGSKSLQFLAKKAQTNPKAKALLERIKTKHTKNQSNLATMSNQNPKNDKITPQNPQGQNQMKLDKFLDSKGKMSEESLRPYAMPMPKQNFSNKKEFKALFSDTQGNFGFIKTPYKEVKVNMSYAYRHFYDNTYKTNRDNIKSAFFDTFRDPLFIAKNDSKGRDSVYFFKPFLDKNENVMSLFGIGIDKNGKVDFKTFYLDNSGARIREMQKLADENILYVKNE